MNYHVRRGLVRYTSEITRGRWHLLVVLAAWGKSSLVAAEANPILRFPQESDRMIVLVAGVILIAGMGLIVNQLRKRARQRSEGE